MSSFNIEKELQEIKQLLSNQASKPMTLEEASKYLHISKSYLYTMTHTRKISYFKPGGKKILFYKSQLDAWVQRNRVRADYEIDEMANEYVLSSKRKS